MKNKTRGATLAELMVAVAILSIGILGFFGAFTYITKSLHVSRTRTLATNLAQEKIETLKNLPYYQVLITTASNNDTNFNPAVVYDNSNYPAETIKIGGVTFIRYTYVALAAMSNNVVSTVAYTYPDSGLKQMTSTVVWNDQGVWKKWSLNNLLENPNIDPLDSSFSGTVQDTAGHNIGAAVVKVEQNPAWNSVTASNGAFSFRVYHGSYTVRASSAGYYDNVTSVQQAVQGSDTPVGTIQLTAIASGTLTGNVWYNSGLVVSQVLFSSVQANGYDLEYVELYNPTTYTVTIGGSPPKVKLNYEATCGGSHLITCTDATNGILLDYVNNSVDPGHYYLIANTKTFTINGILTTADAYYDDNDAGCSTPPLGPDWITIGVGTRRHLSVIGHNGSFWITDAGGNWIDGVGWNHSAQPIPPGCSPNCPDLSGTSSGGASVGDIMVRISTPAASSADIDNYGRAYDSGDNTIDFQYPPTHTGIAHQPQTTTGPTKTTITGIPAIGALVAASDPLSGSTATYQTFYVSGGINYPVASFSYGGVSTGTWSLDVALNAFYHQVTTITVVQGKIQNVPNANTSPTWIASNATGLLMTSSTVNGFVKGNVTDINGHSIAGITVTAAGVTNITGSNGDYFATVASGPITVICNPNNSNPSYIQQLAFPSIPTLGVITQNFVLSQGGALQGFLTTGTTPLPNFVVAASLGGYQQGSATSDASGTFTIRNLSTGTYLVFPIMDPGMDSSPLNITATVSSIGTVFIGTFTVSGALGAIAGNVTNNGSLVTTGALVVASPAAIGSTPPVIAASSSSAMTPVYAVSSLADGSYNLAVRGGTTYHLSVYIPIVAANGTVSISTKTYSGINVNPSATSSQNVIFP